MAGDWKEITAKEIAAEGAKGERKERKEGQFSGKERGERLDKQRGFAV